VVVRGCSAVVTVLQKPRQQTHCRGVGPKPHVHIKAAKRDEDDPSTPWEGRAKLTAFVVADETAIDARYVKGDPLE